jgi:hypothetical protein
MEFGSGTVKAALEDKLTHLSWLQFDKEVMNSHPSLSFASRSLFSYNLRYCKARSVPSVRGTYLLNQFASSWSVWRLNQGWIL